MVHKHEWTPQSVRRFWDNISGSELEDRSFGKLAGPRIAEIIHPFLNKDDDIIDWGGGDGSFANVLLDVGFHVAAFEASPDREDVQESKRNVVIHCPFWFLTAPMRPHDVSFRPQ